LKSYTDICLEITFDPTFFFKTVAPTLINILKRFQHFFISSGTDTGDAHGARVLQRLRLRTGSHGAP
jgi:hypothetical protein